MPDDERRRGVTDDAVLGGRLRLLQPKRGHRFGHDGVLLAAATAARAGDHVVDLGAGVGVAGLALASRVPGLTVMLVESDPALTELAAENGRRNQLEQHVRAVTLDAIAPARAFAAVGLRSGTVQQVMMNPPFNDPAKHNLSPDVARARAHAGGREILNAWCRTASRLLAPKGMVTLVWRADGLADLPPALGSSFGGIKIFPIYPRAETPAIRILVAAMKGSRTPLSLLPGLILNDAEGRPTPEAEAVLRSGVPLLLAKP